MWRLTRDQVSRWNMVAMGGSKRFETPVAVTAQSTYNELTDSPKAIRRIVSASSSATLS